MPLTMASARLRTASFRRWRRCGSAPSSCSGRARRRSAPESAAWRAAAGSELAVGELQAALLVRARGVVQLADALPEVGGHAGAQHRAALDHEVDGAEQLLRLRVLGHVAPRAPAVIALKSASLSSRALRMMTLTSSPRSLRRRATSRPLMPGIEMSRRRMHPGFSPTLAIASSPVAASATTSYPSASRSCLSPCRKRPWSSAMMTRPLSVIESPPGVRRGPGRSRPRRVSGRYHACPPWTSASAPPAPWYPLAEQDWNAFGQRCRDIDAGLAWQLVIEHGAVPRGATPRDRRPAPTAVTEAPHDSRASTSTARRAGSSSTIRIRAPASLLAVRQREHHGEFRAAATPVGGADVAAGGLHQGPHQPEAQAGAAGFVLKNAANTSPEGSPGPRSATRSAT